ncbi:MAG: protoporphyrinogen oxidase [Anaerolineae bacterium]
MTAETRHVVIVGGGIAGLATAYYLQKEAQAQDLPLTCSLIERGPAFGGKIVSDTTGGFVIEGGPDSFISQKPWAWQLCRELGLGERLIGTNDERRKTYILHKGRLRPLPDGVMLIVPTRFAPFALSPLISPWGKLRMGLDLFIPPKADDADESLADFIRRRLGREALDKIAEPLMAGIYVADPQRLSLRSTFPRFIQLEKKHGSLIKGMLALKRASANGQTPARPRLPLFMTLRGGLTELVETLVAKLDGELLAGQTVTGLALDPGGGRPYRLQLDGGQTRRADAVVMATPAYVTARLVEAHSPALAAQLNSIRYLSTATVSLAFNKAEISHPLDGFGFVVPRRERCRLMACTWVSTKFDGRAPAGQVLLRVFVGGYKHEPLVDLGDDELVALVREELARIMGIKAQPTVQRIYRWPKANAQYDVGHLERVAAMEALARQALPGLYLTGSAFRGVGLPDCIHQGQQTAGQVIRDLVGGD